MGERGSIHITKRKAAQDNIEQESSTSEGSETVGKRQSLEESPEPVLPLYVTTTPCYRPQVCRGGRPRPRPPWRYTGREYPQKIMDEVLQTMDDAIQGAKEGRIT